MLKALFGNPSYDAACNVLLAEHSLGLTELVKENPFARELADAIIEIFISSSGIRHNEESAIQRFNSENRVIQLCHVAMALNYLGFSPDLDRENWRDMSNPYVLKIKESIPKAKTYFSKRHGVTVVLSNSNLAIYDWGLGNSSE